MSGADYTPCMHCGHKAFYDADTDTSGTVTFHAECLSEHDAEVAGRAWVEGFRRGHEVRGEQP